MKKLVLFALILSMLFSCFTVLADDEIIVELDGVKIDCKDANGNPVPPILVGGTTYVPVRAIATALNLDIQWDGVTQSIFINGVSVLAKKTDTINIFINGAKFIPTDKNGNVVNPFYQSGTNYLPVRAIGEAFGKDVVWDGVNRVVRLTTPPEPVIEYTVISKDKLYAFVNVKSGKALTATDHNTVVMSDFDKNSTAQGFKFVPASRDGYYNIQSVFNNQNFDVSEHSTTAGTEIITWDSTGADNQVFTYRDIEGGTLVYSLSSGLPIEPGVDKLIQNTNTNDPVQLWKITEINPPVQEKPVATSGAYRTFTVGNMLLSDNGGLVIANANNQNSQKWKLTEVGDSEYLITNLATEMAIDVSGQSMNAGDAIGTWYLNQDPNQRWMLEKQADGTYLIKSVHSGLYLTATDNNTLIQTYRSANLKQAWTMGYTD